MLLDNPAFLMCAKAGSTEGLLISLRLVDKQMHVGMANCALLLYFIAF